MLESILYIALGALLAILVVLLIAPAIWRRAVVLTRQRMEAAVPLTLSELQAEKDQLRAGHALAVRKLEDTIKRLSDKLAAAAIDVARRRDTVFELESKGVRHSARILELETETSELTDDLRDTRSKLDRTTTDLQAARSDMAQRALELETLNARHLEISDDFDGQKIEIVARETRLEAAQQQIRELRDALKRKTEDADRLASALKQAKRDLEHGNGKVSAERRKVSALQTAIADHEARLERRNADLARLRATKGDGGELLSEAEQEIDRLNTALNAASMGSGEDMAPLRAMLLDLAARMTAQVAEAEDPASQVDDAQGPTSQVDDVLAAIADLNFDESVARDREDDNDGPADTASTDGPSLEDRIRSHREAAGSS